MAPWCVSKKCGVPLGIGEQIRDTAVDRTDVAALPVDLSGFCVSHLCMELVVQGRYDVYVGA